MKKQISIILMSLVLLNVYSQDSLNTITIEKRKYYQNEERLTNKQLYSILSENPASSENVQMARTNSIIGSSFVISGTVCLLAGSITFLNATIKENNDVQNGNAPGEYNQGWGWLGAAAGLIIVSIPFNVKARKLLNSSVEQHNSSITSTGQKSVEFELMTNSYGIGIRMRF